MALQAAQPALLAAEEQSGPEHILAGKEEGRGQLGSGQKLQLSAEKPSSRVIPSACQGGMEPQACGAAHQKRQKGSRVEAGRAALGRGAAAQQGRDTAR